MTQRLTIGQNKHQKHSGNHDTHHGIRRPDAAGNVRTAQASPQQQLESAIDAAMTSNTRHNNVRASEVLRHFRDRLGRLGDGLLKKVCAYAAMQYHAAGLSEWLYAYLDQHHADHLERARGSGDLEMVLSVLGTYRSENARRYTKGLPAARLNEVLAFGMEQAEAAGKSSDLQARLVHEQAKRLIELAKALLESVEPVPEPPPQVFDGDLQKAWQDLNRLMRWFDGGEVGLQPEQLKHLHGVADSVRRALRGQSHPHAKYAHDLAGRFRAQATAEMARQEWNGSSCPTLESVTQADRELPSNAVPRPPLPPSQSSDLLSSAYMAGTPHAPTLTDNGFELTASQATYVDDVVKAWASAYARECAAERQGEASDSAIRRYVNLMKSLAFQWTVCVRSYCEVKDLLSLHKTLDQPLSEGLRALCLIWSEDQSGRVQQMLEHDKEKRASGAPGLELGLGLFKQARHMVEDKGEQLHRLCQAGDAGKIVEFVEEHRWLPLLLMKRAWTRAEFGELVEWMHGLAQGWQATPGETGLQGLGAALKKMLPPPPMAWTSPEDFIDRLAQAVAQRHLAEVDFALATRRNRLLESLDGLPTASKLQLLAAFDKLLESMEVSKGLKVSWLEHTGFVRMEYQVSLWRPLVQKSLEASRQ